MINFGFATLKGIFFDHLRRRQLINKKVKFYMLKKLRFYSWVLCLTFFTTTSFAQTLLNSTLPAGKSIVAKVVDESNDDITAQYTLSYSGTELKVTQFAGSYVLIGSIVGNYSITATKNADGSTVSIPVSVTAGAVSGISAVSGSGQSSPAGSAFANPITVKVSDSFGNAVAGVPVSFSNSSGSAQIVSNIVNSDSSGLASAQVSAGASAEHEVVSAAITVSGLSKSVSFSETSTALANAAAKLVLNSESPSATVGSNISLSAAAETSSGSISTSFSGLVSVSPYSNSSCTVASSAASSGSVNAVNGVANISNLQALTAGTVYFKISASGLTSVCSQSLTILPLSTGLSSLKIIQLPTLLKANQNLFPAIRVEELDNNGQLLTSATDVVQIIAYDDSSCTQVSSISLTNDSVNSVSGYSTFANLQANTAKTIYVKAVSGSASSACSSALVVIQGSSTPTPTPSPTATPLVCNGDQHILNNACVSNTQSCVIANGAGIQTWNSTTSMFGSCVVSSCSATYHVDVTANSCDSNTEACTIANGSGVATWNGSAYANCSVSTCSSTYHVDVTSNSCDSNTQACTIANGAGVATWNGSAYANCSVSTCSSTYHVDVTSNSCDSNTQACTIANGAGVATWNGSAYANCSVSTCSNTYHVDVAANSCDSNTEACTAGNGTGQAAWNGTAYGSCSLLQCNANYDFISGACYSSCSGVQHRNFTTDACDANTVDCTSSIANATSASETWNGSAYGTCTLGTCSSTYHVDSSANTCDVNTESCTIANGTGNATWSGIAYGSCTLATCNPGYYISGNSCLAQVCSPNSVASCPITNGTGQETCDTLGDAYGSCVLATCNSGYINSSGTCVIDYDTVTVAIAGTGTGTVTGTPSSGTGSILCPPLSSCSSQFVDGTTLTLSSVADYGSTFSGYSGDFTSSNATDSFLVNNSKNVNANFISNFIKTKGLNGQVYAAVLDSIGNLYIGGSFSFYNSQPVGYIAKFKSDGTLDPTFNSLGGFNSAVYSLAFDSTGNLWAGGSFSSYGGGSLNAIYLAKLNATSGVLIKINPSDVSSNTGNGFSGNVQALAYSGGFMYVGGKFTESYVGNAGVSYNANYIGKINVSTGVYTKINPSDVNSTTGNGFNKVGVASVVDALAVDASGNVYIGGTFTESYIGDTGVANNANRIAKISSTGVKTVINSKDTNSSTGNGFNGTVSSLILDSSSNLYVGGSFTESYVGGSGATYNANYIAKISSTGTLLAINSNDTASITGNGVNSTVNSLILDSSSNLYVGGSFTESYVGNTGLANNANRIAKISSTGTLLAINSNDTASITGNGVNSTVNSLILDSSSNLYVGGSFTESYVGNSSNASNDLARINLTSGFDLSYRLQSGSGFNAYVQTMAIDSSGNIYAGGGFTSYNGQPVNGLAKLDSHGNLLKINPNDVWTATGNGVAGSVYSISFDSHGNLWIGGSFTESYIGDTGVANNANRIAKISSTGTLLAINSNDIASATGNGFNSYVQSIAFDSNYNTYVGGSFTESYVGNTGAANNANYLAKLNSSGVKVAVNSGDSISATGNGFDQEVVTLAVDSTNNLYVGGALQTSYVGGSGTLYNANYIAKLNSSGVKVSLNPGDTASATGNGFDSYVDRLVFDSFNNLWIGGQFHNTYIGNTNTSFNANGLLKLSSTGTKLSINPNDVAGSTGNGTANFVEDISFDSSGNAYVLGAFTESYIGNTGSTNNANEILKLNSSGTVVKLNANDSSSVTGNGFSAIAYKSVVDNTNGFLYVVGSPTISYIGNQTNPMGYIIKIKMSDGTIAP
jgi:hypothetical protein